MLQDVDNYLSEILSTYDENVEYKDKLTRINYLNQELNRKSDQYQAAISGKSKSVLDKIMSEMWDIAHEIAKLTNIHGRPIHTSKITANFDAVTKAINRFVKEELRPIYPGLAKQLERKIKFKKPYIYILD